MEHWLFNLHERGFDIPEGRRRDINWLLRNLGIREENRNHPEFDWVMRALADALAKGLE